MAKIHVLNTEYVSKLAGSYSEADFEKVLYSHRELLFPNEVLVYFKADVRWGDDVRRADFALVDRGYRYWCVVEVELAHHDFHSHVFPQVEVLRNGEYSEVHANAISREAVELDKRRLENLVVGSSPQVWVVVDRPVERWREALKAMRVSLGVFEVYESGKASIAIRVDGSRPSSRVESFGVIRNLMGRVWSVENFPVLRDVGVSQVPIIFEEMEWQWNVRELGGVLSIVSSGDIMPLDTNKRYYLSQLQDGTFRLSKKKPVEKADFDEI